MLSPHPTHRSKDQDQKKLGIGQTALHGSEYPYIAEFSEFIANVSIDALKYKLMTYQQRLLARSMWEAENYGGSKHKCIQHLREIYGPKWEQIASIEDYFTDEREYCEHILILSHIDQWDKQKKLATLRETV